MSTPIVYSQRLGSISDAQFQSVATRLGLGRFLGATPITSGLFGQNVFMHTTTGEFVLRGAPHWVKGFGDAAYRQEDRWQFTKERFFAEQLHQRAGVPVPWPMLHDQTSDLLGWPYLVMPRMPGDCFDDRSIVKRLSTMDRTEIALVLGRMLAQMQRVQWPFAGDFSPISINLEPYPSGYTQQVIDETRMYTTMAATNGAVTVEDHAFIDMVCAQAQAMQQSRPNTFVHGDYKLNNLTVLSDQRGWRVAGIFDLHEARFGDGVMDLVRQTCAYLDTDPPMADGFVRSYFDDVQRDDSIRHLLPLYVVNDRMKIWEYFSRPEAPAKWRQGKSFHRWGGGYVKAVLEVFDRVGSHE